MKKSLSIIIPVYNEAEGIPPLIERLESVAQQLTQKFALDVGFVFIDDGSSDNSFRILKNWNFSGRRVRLLQFSRNFGKEAALSAGIDAAQDSDAAILMDADLQHPPEMILEFVRIWQEEGFDSVYAYKANRRVAEGLPKAILSKLFYGVINYGLRYKIEPDAGDFRLINKRFMQALCGLHESERFMKGLYSWVGFRQMGIPFVVPPRQHGKSNFNFLRLLTMTLDALTSFTTVPLRIMALLGALIALLSGFYGLYIIIEHFFFPGVPAGFASILALISFFGGMQILFLGLLGEYVGKAVSEAKKRPAYIIAEDIMHEGHNAESRG